MKKKTLCILAAALLLTGCGKIPTLENGQEAVVTFENGDKISVDELYTEIKDTFGLQSLITMIDTKVLENEFKDYKEEATNMVESTLKAALANYSSEEEFVKAIQSYFGFSSLDAYKEYMYLSYLQSHATEEYAKEQITDKEIKNYYNDSVVGDIEISHILIVPEVTDKMTNEEITKAESTAQEKANDILKELKNTKSSELKAKFEELAKENSDDGATKNKGGSLGKINKIGDNYLGSNYDEITNNAYAINDGEIYTKVVKTEVGYHIIYRSKSYEKPELEDVKDTIKETLANDLIQNDNTIATKALQYYRDKSGMNIVDEELHTQYAYYIQNSLNQDN